MIFVRCARGNMCAPLAPDPHPLAISELHGTPGHEKRERSISSGRQRLRLPSGVVQGFPQSQAGPLHSAPQESIQEPRAASSVRRRWRWCEGQGQARGPFPSPTQGSGRDGGRTEAATGSKEAIWRCVCLSEMRKG